MTGKRRRWPAWATQALLILALFVGIRMYMTRDAASGPAPELEGVLLDGSPVSLEHYRGRPLLVHFWATWCPVCSLEQDNIDAVARDHAVLSVAMQSGTAEEVREHMRKEGLGFPVLVDESGELSARWGVRGVPTSFVLDGEGGIEFVEAGFATGWGLRLRLWWAGR